MGSDPKSSLESELADVSKQPPTSSFKIYRLPPTVLDDRDDSLNRGEEEITQPVRWTRCGDGGVDRNLKQYPSTNWRTSKKLTQSQLRAGRAIIKKYRSWPRVLSTNDCI